MVFGGLTSAWEAVPWDEAVRRYPFLDSEDVELDALYGELPEHVHVHTGDLALTGGAAVGCGVAEAGDDAASVEVVHVVDGDLSMGGALRFFNDGHYPMLAVTGAVAVEHLVCESECALFVGGALRVDGLLVTDLYEAGFLHVEGPASVGAWLQAEVRPDEARVHLGGSTVPPSAPDGVVLPAYVDGGRLDVRALAAAAVEGRPVLSGALRPASR